MNPYEKLKNIQAYVQSQVLEREQETQGAILALLSGESCLFLGEPGAAKTLHVTLLAKYMDLSLFDILMSDTTKPESIFGPVDVPALANEGIQRFKIDGYAPSSQVLFFDEIFKASGVVLNTLLGILNERVFRNGDEGMIKCPVISVFAASNEVPLDKASRPVYDRFLLRYNVSYLNSKKSIHQLFDNTLNRGEVEEPEQMTLQELRWLQDRVRNVEVPIEVRNLVIKVRDTIKKMKISVSDRRLAKSLRVIQAHAYLNGRRTAEAIDVSILADMLWDDPETAPKVKSAVMSLTDAGGGDLDTMLNSALNIVKNSEESGDYETALVKLNKIFEKTKDFTTSSGVSLRNRIENLIEDLKTMIADRREMLIFVIDDQANHSPWFKLATSSAELWSASQIRSVGFSLKRKEGYWRRENTTAEALEKEVREVLGAVVKFKQIV